MNESDVLGAAYLARWNDDEQARIDRDIERYRKTDAEIFLPSDAAPGSPVEVEQLTHRFVFGAHIFNFNQLGTPERNARYRELFGSLFNSATIAFYWKKQELEEGKPRFAGEDRDSEAFWNQVADPQLEPHWRRPAPDPVVEFCESKGIRLHGHPLTWGNTKWHFPEFFQKYLPPPYNDPKYRGGDQDASPLAEIFAAMPQQEVESLCRDYAKLINERHASRILELALHYRGRIHSWDVVNESATDFGLGRQHEGDSLTRSVYGLLPGDYTYRSLMIAAGVFPQEVKLNINDWNLTDDYVDQVDDLLRRGSKIDIIGAQMHLFKPQQCLDIAAGISDEQSPVRVRETMERLAANGRPIHLSEITITAPGNDHRGQLIQAALTRNLYRLWFSLKPMMGITWWNVVDDCGAPGEPSVSGLFSRDMQPKPAYQVLDELINHTWRTRLSLEADAAGRVAFRGFRGRYRLTYQTTAGIARQLELELD